MAAAEGEAADARHRDDAGRHAEAEGVRGVIQVAELRAARDLCGHRAGVHAYPAHRRQVEDEPVVHQAQPGSAVTAPAYREFRAAVPGAGEHGPHVRHVHAPGDGRGASVDHGVVDAAGLVVARVVRGDDRTPQRLAQPFDNRSVDAAHDRPLCVKTVNRGRKTAHDVRAVRGGVVRGSVRTSYGCRRGAPARRNPVFTPGSAGACRPRACPGPLCPAPGRLPPPTSPPVHAATRPARGGPSVRRRRARWIGRVRSS